MRAGQPSPLRIDRVGHQFGELTAVRLVTRGKYRYAQCLRHYQVYELICKLGHVEQRNTTSLVVTGDKTHCKECRRLHIWTKAL